MHRCYYDAFHFFNSNRASMNRLPYGTMILTRPPRTRTKVDGPPHGRIWKADGLTKSCGNVCVRNIHLGLYYLKKIKIH